MPKILRILLLLFPYALPLLAQEEPTRIRDRGNHELIDHEAANYAGQTNWNQLKPAIQKAPEHPGPKQQPLAKIPITQPDTIVEVKREIIAIAPEPTPPIEQDSIPLLLDPNSSSTLSNPTKKINENPFLIPLISLEVLSIPSTPNSLSQMNWDFLIATFSPLPNEVENVIPEKTYPSSNSLSTSTLPLRPLPSSRSKRVPPIRLSELTSPSFKEPYFISEVSYIPHKTLQLSEDKTYLNEPPTLLLTEVNPTEIEPEEVQSSVTEEVTEPAENTESPLATNLKISRTQRKHAIRLNSNPAEAATIPEDPSQVPVLPIFIPTEPEARIPPNAIENITLPKEAETTEDPLNESDQVALQETRQTFAKARNGLVKLGSATPTTGARPQQGLGSPTKDIYSASAVRSPNLTTTAPVSKTPMVLSSGFITHWSGLQTQLTFPIEGLPSPTLLNEPSELAAFRAQFSPEMLEEILKPLETLRSQHKLGDMAWYQLLYSTGKTLYPLHDNASRVVCAALMQSSGYGVRTALQNGKVALIIPVKQNLYEIPRITLPGMPRNHGKHGWYLWMPDQDSLSLSSLQTETLPFIRNEKSIDLYPSEHPDFPKDSILESRIIYRELLSLKRDTFPYKINLRYLAYLRQLPQTDLEVYFSASLSPELKESLVPALKKKTQNLSPPEALQWLLRFTQLAIPYKSDQDQFGKEKAMYPEEVLFYPYADCEDRSVFFAALVREVLGRPVIGLDFPGHVATAVMVPGKEARGFTVKYNGRIFIACDPTYKYASPGAIIPGYERQSARPIVTPFFR